MRGISRLWIAGLAALAAAPAFAQAPKVSTPAATVSTGGAVSVGTPALPTPKLPSNVTLPAGATVPAAANGQAQSTAPHAATPAQPNATAPNTPPPGAPPPRVEEPPPGMVETNIVSHFDDQVWDVFAGGEIVCTTPCTQWLPAGQPLELRARDGDEVYVFGLGPEAAEARHAMLVAEGTCIGKQTNGIVFTTLGGMGVITAITLTAVGCSDIQNHRGLCNAGLITGGISVPLTAVSIWMIVDSVPKAHVLPMLQMQGLKGEPPVTVAFAPTGIVGTF